MCLQSKVIPCIVCPTEHALYALHECGNWEEGGELGCSVVQWLYTLLACMYVYCACVCHTVHVWVSMNTVPLYHWSSLLHVHVHCMLQFSQLSSYHFPVPFDPLVDFLVTCQSLTSLELTLITVSFQSLLAIVKGLHNLRALGLYSVWVCLSDERVSD